LEKGVRTGQLRQENYLKSGIKKINRKKKELLSQFFFQEPPAGIEPATY
jgi:hypothetical protein